MPEPNNGTGRNHEILEHGGQHHTGGLISLSGLPLSGKTTVVNILSKSGYWHSDGFLTDCRKVAQEILLAMGYSGGVLESMISGRLRDAQSPIMRQTTRNLVHIIASLFSRHPYFADIWTQRLMLRVHAVRKTGANVVLDDLASIQSARTVGAAGGMKIWITRSENTLSRVRSGEDRVRLMEQMNALFPGPRWHHANQRSVLIETVLSTLLDCPSLLPGEKETKAVVERSIDRILLPFVRGQIAFEEPAKNKMSDRRADIEIVNGGTLHDLSRAVEDIMASTDLHMIAAAIQETDPHDSRS